MAAVLLIVLPSCGARRDVPAGAVLSAILMREEHCPSGTVYSASAGEGEKGYFSESLCTALYGDEAPPVEWSLIADYAIFLTAAEHPTELAVFRCRSVADAEEVARLCSRRLTLLRQYWRGSEYESYPLGGRVVILGSYVVMAVCSDSLRAVGEARNALGS